MKPERSYTVIAVAEGDRYGFGIWSERFNTRAVADLASAFLKENEYPTIRVLVIEDDCT